MISDTAVIATMTRARNEEERERLYRSLTALSSLGLPIVIADRESPLSFVAALARLPNVWLVTSKRPGLVGQIQASIAAATRMRRPLIVYTEPDKQEFFEGPLAAFVERAADAARGGVVLAARSVSAFRTFPRRQRVTETTANALCRDVLGLDADYFYGPFVMTRDLAAHVTRTPLDVGWGWRPFLFATARRLGYSLTAQIGDFVCPSSMCEEDDPAAEQYRVRQLIENASGLAAAWRLDWLLLNTGECPPDPRSQPIR
jgi:hypothetical protein